MKFKELVVQRRSTILKGMKNYEKTEENQQLKKFEIVAQNRKHNTDINNDDDADNFESHGMSSQDGNFNRELSSKKRNKNHQSFKYHRRSSSSKGFQKDLRQSLILRRGSEEFEDGLDSNGEEIVMDAESEMRFMRNREIDQKYPNFESIIQEIKNGKFAVVVDELEYEILFEKFPQITENGVILHELIDSLVKMPKQTLQIKKENSLKYSLSQKLQKDKNDTSTFSNHLDPYQNQLSKENSGQSFQSAQQEMFDQIHQLTSRSFYPFRFPKGHFAKMYLKTVNDDPIKKVYINQRFYLIEEIQFNFWFLIYIKQIKLAATLADNESGKIEPFLEQICRLLGEDRQKLSQHKLFHKLVQPQGLKWGLREAVKLNLDRFVTEELKENNQLMRDSSFITEVKALAIQNKCIRLIRLLYSHLMNPIYQQRFYQEQSIKHPYGEIKHFLKNPDNKVIIEKNLKVIKVYQQKIKELERRVKQFQAQMSDNAWNSYNTAAKSKKKLAEIKRLKVDLEEELIKLVTCPQFMENPFLTEKLEKNQCYFVIPHLIKERLIKKECIQDQQIFLKDFTTVLKLWDKFNFQSMQEITLKMLQDESNLQALNFEETQKSIIKIILVRVYIGSELLAKINIQKWDKDLSKELLNALEQHCKDPSQLIYSPRPIVTLCLIVEFIESLLMTSNRYKNKCRGLTQQFLNIGGKFIKEIKDYEMAKFFVQQQDSKK